MCIICRTPNVQELVGLTSLYCSNCPLLTAIPKELVGLTALYCWNCPLLTAIPKELVGLTSLYCHNCPLLTAIPKELVRLITLYCYKCPLLTAIPKEFVGLAGLNCSGCPWLPQNASRYPTHLPSALLVQRRWLSPLRRFLKLARSRAFCEHFYDPDQMGGRWAKRELEAFARGIEQAQTQARADVASARESEVVLWERVQRQRLDEAGSFVSPRR
jgi:hypothetical protein